MRNFIVLILIIMGGVIGISIGDLCANLNGLSWLALGGKIGISEPVILDLQFIQFTIGFWCKINIAGVIGLILSAFIAKPVTRWIKL